MPKSRQKFWLPKLEGIRCRDRENREKLNELGWEVLEIWECEVGNLESVQSRIRDFLEPAQAGP